MKGAYAVQVAEGAKNEILIVLHAAGIYLQLVVIVSGGVETFHYLVYVSDHRCELTAEFLAVVFQTDIAEDHDAVAGLDGIDYRYIFLYITFLLQPLLTLEDR